MVDFVAELCSMQQSLDNGFVLDVPLGSSFWGSAGGKSLLNNCETFENKISQTQWRRKDQRLESRILTNLPSVHSAILKMQEEKKSFTNEDFLNCVNLGSEIMKLAKAEKGNGHWGEYGDMCEEEVKWGEYYSAEYDDITGEELDPKLVKKGQMEEMRRFEQMKVYDYVLRGEAQKNSNGKFVGVRWVKVNKGTVADPNVRCRLVAQEYAKGEIRDDLFAATPPLFALKLLLSDVASLKETGGKKCIMTLDVKAAFLYGDTKRDVYIELPKEDPWADDFIWVGKLRKAMYGTRDAPQVWYEEVRALMLLLGFCQSKINPCVYYHEQKDLRVMVHVDDFLCTGEEGELEWFRKQVLKRFEITSKIIGRTADPFGSTVFLGRTIRWTKNGLEIEGEVKYFKAMLKEWGMENAKSVDTPWVKEEDDGNQVEGEAMDKVEATRFRRSAARINYMSLERADLGQASKEIAKHMAKPRIGDERKIKRVIRYLIKNPTFVSYFDWQAGCRDLVLFTDSDWANDTVTRRSTSGGVVMIGGHLISHWSRVQNSIALSSGEAELNAAIKGISEIIGISNLGEEIGLGFRITHKVDASACKGILVRSGAGKVKHLSVRQLWVQEAVEKLKINVMKVPREKNLADLMARGNTAKESLDHRRGMNFGMRYGRSFELW